ncbi:MAG: ATP-binding cassette domain-containing protein, partial [Gemmatimonadetes bacterium]|nr:ATP-binding cassette domain-containing protein [Gemmatimonadota bacterium]
SLAVRRGEILGIAGVGGNGQRTLAAVLAGLRAPDAGEAVLPDEVGWIPQERDGEGLVNDFTIAENVALAVHAKGAYRKGVWLDWGAVEEAAAALVGEMDVRSGAPEVAAGTLSGGNQQKMVAGREFLRSAELLVAESPTRGLDVKATVAVRERIRTLATDGDRAPGIVLISADLDEILELSDRIAVMVRGRLIPVPPEDHDPAAIGELMLGVSSRGGDIDRADARDRARPGEPAG